MQTVELAESLLSGNRRALARAITVVETGGAILGDRIRMQPLGGDPGIFIRSMASRGRLGGIAHATSDAIDLLDAARFDVVLVETVGIGQSETVVADMTDFFLVLMLPGAGDELQGIKKGIVEMADHVLINKADGDNRLRAEQAAAEQAAALHYLHPATPGWHTEVALCSGLTGQGVPELWQRVDQYYLELTASGLIAQRRQQQLVEWLSDLVHDELRRRFYQDARVRTELPRLREMLVAGEITAVNAAHRLLAIHARHPDASRSDAFPPPV